MIEIHSTAIVDKKAQIGENVSIGAFSVVEGDVVIQDETQIGPHTLIANGARIGKNVKIHNGAVVSTVPQDLKFGGESTTFQIGDNTTVREFCTLNRGTDAHQTSIVGKDCLVMAYAHVAHDCIIGDNVILANGVQLGGHVEIEDWAIIGGMTPIHQFCHVGQHCMVGGGLRVIQDIPPYILVGGEPLRFGGLNSIGLQRRGFSSDVITALKRAYRLIYRSNLNISQAVDRIKNELEITPEINNVLDFINRSDRGILKSK